MSQDTKALLLPNAPYYFIAHLLDRVLVGEDHDEACQLVLEAIKQKQFIEVHFFNEDQEVFVAMEGEQIICYKPVLHQDDGIDRYYKLETNRSGNPRWGNYKYLQTRDYLAFGKEDHLAYVEKTVLLKLIR